ncbi:hypothetical protein KOI35_26120 [Actinoplanes bogorensis]|uniref:Uncharacterized protein n=1 Tax=Paractinoplanes bogorensis TaxID=1610840 RepID=A0ABS5YW85_9ACTN|nr:hypothetical protein [Actinoplanes bogorensis]MBU2666993.1 hypothetical protein [Actinoplanes bogorensis]
MLRQPLVTDDPFWRARTEDGNGRIMAGSSLEDVAAWRAMRLSVDLTAQLYHRIGLSPVPRGDDLLTSFEFQSVDCAVENPYGGRIEPPEADVASWAQVVEHRLADLPAGGVGHERCRHAQAQAQVPLMWQVALMLRTARGVRPGPYVRAVPYAKVVKQIGGPVAMADAFDREGTWFLVHSTETCALSPTGGAYFDDGYIDLAGMARHGSTPGELAAAIEDQLAEAPVQPMAAIAWRAGMGAPPIGAEYGIPPWLQAFQDDATIALAVPWGASRELVDAALGIGLVQVEERDLHLILPAGMEAVTCRRVAFLAPRIRVWIHDGFRVTPAPIPARAEVFAAARADSWRLDRDARHTIHHRRLGRVLGDRAARWRWLGQFSHGGEPVDLAVGPMLRVVVDATEPDVMTVPHAIDHWIWAQASLDELRSVVEDLPVEEPVMLSFVVGDPRGQATVNPWTDVQLEMLAGWPLRSEMIRVDRYDSPDPAIDVEQTMPWSTSPVVGERPSPRWAARMQAALTSAAGGPSWPTPEAPIIESARRAHEDLKARGFQPATRRVTSMPAFAINLFGPLTPDGVAAIFEAQGMPVLRAEAPQLFWRDPENRLRDGLTGVDVLLRGFADDLEPVALLVCVKLVEEGFDECQYHQSAANPRRSACRTAAPFGGDPAACFQTRRHDPAQPAPRYFEVLAPATVAHPDGGCPFRVDNEQMRLLALADALRDSGDYTATRVLLCAPKANQAVWRRLDEASRPFQDPEHALLGRLPAEDVLELAGHPEAELMRWRYHLEEDARVHVR